MFSLTDTAKDKIRGLIDLTEEENLIQRKIKKLEKELANNTEDKIKHAENVACFLPYNLPPTFINVDGHSYVLEVKKNNEFDTNYAVVTEVSFIKKIDIVI